MFKTTPISQSVHVDVIGYLLIGVDADAQHARALCEHLDELGVVAETFHGAPVQFAGVVCRALGRSLTLKVYISQPKIYNSIIARENNK